MRLPALIAVLVVAAPIGLCAGSASAQFFQDQSVLFGRRHAYEGPWCAHSNSGGDRVEEDCGFNTFEACRRAVLGENSSFCTQNPAFDGYPQPVRKKKGNRERR